MANGIVPDEGLAQELNDLLVNAGTSFAAWQVMLWVNDFVPDFDTVLADLVEATFPGYSRRALTAVNWSAPTITAHLATSQNGATAQSWTVGGGSDVTVFGHAYVDTIAGVLRLVQRWDDADIAPVSPGGTIELQPRFTLRSQLASE